MQVLSTTEEIHNIKTVPIYYDEDIIGSAKIETITNVVIPNTDKITEVYGYSEIKMKREYKHLIVYHHLEMCSVIDKEEFQGVAMTLEYPNRELAVNKKNRIFPFKPN